MIGMAKPFVGEEEIAAVVEVMRSGMLATGPVVTQFEKAFNDYIGAQHGVANVNGTTALHVALLGLGIKEGDKVLTTPFTFIASSNSILFNRAIPVFIDIDPKTYVIDPDKLEAYLEKHYDSSMKAILVVHLFGLACDMPRIMKIAERYNLRVIEDCAQSHGAEIDGRRAGSFGDAASFSFYPTKNMMTGEGGITLFRNGDEAALGRKYVNHGRVDQYLHDVLGYNYRMTSICAAIGLEQLKRLDGFNSRRRANAAIYNESFASLDAIDTPFVPAGYTHVYHQYTISLKQGDRNDLQKYLADKKIGSAVVYPFSMNEQPFYKGVCEYDDVSIAEATSRRVLSLPVHPMLTPDEVQTVASAVTSYFA
ncbi:DegT/DnrJ/EryC1/StrS family aminotransferase [Chitinimonas koreensis]|uniref:DegT/DnrJ/EryC1/StrS family aminotransferase n=1 Tax=Chitinimonas koreensis TaxID=356302 RepID=UPI0003F55204|nr:DegT/DnrJ/EryC1/StrS family aminotransferase [Chitinimonas koreensis]QNM98064.1 DegT/DnrJ/EryC1/StrS family aminotransferase [Chitinimonas koreensis]